MSPGPICVPSGILICDPSIRLDMGRELGAAVPHSVTPIDFNRPNHRPSDRCLSVLSCLSCLSVTLVYCGQTVEWIKIKLGMQVGLGPRHVVLDGDPAPPPKRGIHPNFRPISVLAKWLDEYATW